MASLEEIAIEHIEKNSRIELPQDERRIIREIISKYEFDEGNARMLGDLYINTYNLPNTIWEEFSTVLNQTLEENEKNLLGSKQLNKLLYFFHEITKFYHTHKSTQQLHLTIYSNNLLHLLCQTHNRQNQTIVSKYLEILDKLFQLDRNFLFPSHLDIDGNEDEIYKNRNDFIGALSFPENMDEVKKEEHRITQHTDKLIEFLDELLKYKLSNNKPITIPQPLTNIMYYSLDRQYMRLDKLVRGTQFLSRHNSEEESLSDVLGKMIDIMSIEIPDYEIIDFLGEGAYKRTYLARDVNLGHQVALKIINLLSVACKPNIERALKAKLKDKFDGNIESAIVTIFQEEAKLMLRATQTRSNYIPIIYRAYYDPRLDLYIIAEELGDQTLNHMICNNEIKTIELIVYLIKNIVRGVEDLHKLGFAHGDIKPDNILINTDGKIRITDFGWSSQIPLLSEHYEDPRYLTNLLTCAPEIFDGKHPDQKSDTWSIGIITYRMFTGEWPFNHGFTGNEEEWRKLSLEEKQKYARKIREQMTEERIREINQSISEQIKEIMSRPKYYGDHDDLNFIYKFIHQSLQIQYENRKMHDGGPLIRFERPIPKHTSGLYGD